MCLQQHTIQLLTVLQKPLTRLLESFSRNLSRKANASPLGLPYNGENPDNGNAVLLCVQCKAILPLKIQVLSLRIALMIEMTDEEKH